MTVTYSIVLALTLFVSAHAAGGWSYGDAANWGKSFEACDKKAQSPINIVPSMAKYEPKLNQFEFSGFETSVQHAIVNNGHTIQVNIKNKVTTTGGGLPGKYTALQFHFHWSADHADKGSEHVLDGKAYPLEVHIVHMNQAYANVSEALKKSDGLAVLGFFFEIGATNKAMDEFLGDIPSIKGSDDTGSFSLADLLGSMDGLEEYFRYEGSLTTPPCSEAVVWTVFKKTLTISKEQLGALWDVEDSHKKRYSNYRAVQKLNGRSIYTSIKSSGMMTTAISVLVFFSVLLSATNLW